MSVLFTIPTSENFRFADVIIPLNVPHALTYGVPEAMQSQIKIGMSVGVSLGRNKQYSAIVVKLHNDKPNAYDVKPIKSILDDEPIVNATQLAFWSWIAEYYIAAPGEVMQAALPAHLKLMSETILHWNGESKMYSWSDEAFLAAEALELKKELSISELRIIVGQRHFNQVLYELLENEAITISDTLTQTYKPKKEKIISLHPHYKEEAALVELFNQLEKAPRQLELIMAYVEMSHKHKYVKQIDLLERTQASATQIKTLVDKWVFIVEEKNTDRLIYEGIEEVKNINLSPTQTKAHEQLEQGLEQKNVALLEGVTGSGKTILYVKKIKQILAEGKQAILLLPEIGLTTQLVSRLYAYFGEELGVYHSRFSNNERVEIWEKVKKGIYKIVVGPRSVLWLPYNKLGIIIVDEEHDASYKQKDPSPRFHARDAAIYLAGLHKAKVILGSATPSVESSYNAKRGKYAYVQLAERYQGVNMPEIALIDAKSLDAQKQFNIKLITPELVTAIAEALENRKQVILFQNRRGYAPFQICTLCGWVPHCKNCSVSLTYHKMSDKLHCHYCGMKCAPIHTCASCGSNRLQSRTYGTERIEEEVQQIFPKARVARMDVDSMRNKGSMNDLLERLEKEKIDILVGTQMVVKGLDFANVSLVGILSADSLLSFPDFRVNERAFQLMEQVSGRAGRNDGAGKVLIQTFNLDHPVLHWVKQHDYLAFYEQEIKYRTSFLYPPFARVIKITFKHKDETKAIIAANAMVESLKAMEDIMVQGPVPALVNKVRNMFLQEVWIKCPNDQRLLNTLKSLLKTQQQNIIAQRGNSSLAIVFDVDPV